MASSEGIDWAVLHARIAASAPPRDRARRNEEEILRRRTARYQDPISTEKELGIEVVVFVRDGVHYGVQLCDLKEIRSRDRIAPLPGVSAVIRGIVHVRGQVLAVHDLSALSGRGGPQQQQPWLLLGCGEAESVALLADDVEGIREIKNSQIRPLPLHLSHLEPAFLGVSDSEILLISLPHLIDNPTFFNA